MSSRFKNRSCGHIHNDVLFGIPHLVVEIFKVYMEFLFEIQYLFVIVSVVSPPGSLMAGNTITNSPLIMLFFLNQMRRIIENYHNHNNSILLWKINLLLKVHHFFLFSFGYGHFTTRCYPSMVAEGFFLNIVRQNILKNDHPIRFWFHSQLLSTL